ncbi:hypothetical protein KPL71_021835 [Citrus sinensis]|uniref:Uncharacterized protein n=1 Tax=Citrus sinensis TaxID=2711 RepID=A0ACB8JI57_CITSI|nr:hypothetical protein KPL71_021835 [Citrus sinensis]
MVDAVVSVVLDQLISSAFEEAVERVRRVTAVKAEVDKLTSNLLAIKAVLSDAEQKQVKEKGIRHWLDQLKEASCDMEDVFDEWITASRRLQIKGIPQEKKVCSYFLVLYFLVLSCFGFKLRHDIAQKMKEINENLEGISKQKDRFDLHVTRSSEESVRTQSIASINLPDVRGRVEEKDTLKRKLLFESSEQQNAVQIISLIGMGGIGKTTLAQFVYNDNDVISNFEKRMWVCVSDPFDEYGIAKMIIAALEVPDRDLEDVKSLSFLLDKIEESITGKKFFLVLDDVWTEDYRKWEPFHNCLMKGSHGSKILVTTRKETVSIMMSCTDMITVTGLSTEDCWSLFESIAFFGKSSSEIGQLEAIGKSIVDKCKGLPLAVKTIGSLLRSKCNEELEMIGEEYFNYLASRSFFQEFEKDDMGDVIGCKMHDITHDFAVYLTENECYSTDVNEYMPRGIERLTGLRTLSEFVVGRTGGEHASKVCKLEALKGMNHLRGLLKIRMLGDLANVDEAKHVDLKEKKNLDRLELWFDNVGMPNENEENDEAITKVLQLPPNLEYLGILHYRGRSLIFPNWIESFNKLKKLLFIDCKKCESMPPLGQLPSLEVLTIWYMDSVERVGDEFLGIENSCLHGISSSSSSSLATAFPKLKHLTIKGSKKWDEWYFAKEDITIMPQLNSLDISLCNNLKSLPDQILQSKTLENLTIEKCPILEVRFKKDTGEEWPKISHIPSIRIGHCCEKWGYLFCRSLSLDGSSPPHSYHRFLRAHQWWLRSWNIVKYIARCFATHASYARNSTPVITNHQSQIVERM